MDARRKNGTRGFTMIEVIVVIAVLAILASVAVPLATVFEDRARAKATIDELDGIKTALLAYYEDWGSYPASLADLETGGYLVGQVNDEYGTDGWLHDYQYTASGMTASVSSAGLDFTASTPDDIAVSVSADGIAREITRREMDQIHVALRNYEYQRISASLAPLPSHWADQGGGDGAYTILKDEGLLPSGSDLATDGWGDPYVYSGTPADAVGSANVGAGAAAYGGGSGSGDDDGWGDDEDDHHDWGGSGDDDGEDEGDSRDDESRDRN